MSARSPGPCRWGKRGAALCSPLRNSVAPAWSAGPSALLRRVEQQMRDRGTDPYVAVECSLAAQVGAPVGKTCEEHTRAAAFLGPHRVFVRVGRFRAELRDLLLGACAQLAVVHTGY